MTNTVEESIQLPKLAFDTQTMDREARTGAEREDFNKSVVTC